MLTQLGLNHCIDPRSIPELCPISRLPQLHVLLLNLNTIQYCFDIKLISLHLHVFHFSFWETSNIKLLVLCDFVSIQCTRSGLAPSRNTAHSNHPQNLEQLLSTEFRSNENHDLLHHLSSAVYKNDIFQIQYDLVKVLRFFIISSNARTFSMRRNLSLILILLDFVMIFRAKVLSMLFSTTTLSSRWIPIS